MLWDLHWDLYACSAGYLFIEASAKSGVNVEAVFEAVAERLSGGLPVSHNAEA